MNRVIKTGTMIEIRFLGGCTEVGKLGMLIDTGSEKFLWEYGISVQSGEKPIQPKTNLDGAFVSHAHLDHSGMLPQIYRLGYDGPLYCDPATLDLLSILLRDSLKLQKREGGPLDYLMQDIKKLERNVRFLRVNEKEDFVTSSVSFHNAGHIPGSVMPLLENGGKRILFTGDVKFIETQLMVGAQTKFKDIDLLISESTYSYTNHPDRKSLETSLKKIVQETVHGGGICLIPAFAVGRTQELLMILYELGVPIYIDGMGIRATEAILRHPKNVKDHKTLQKAFSRAHKVERGTNRDRITESPCVILTTAGMLNGGPVVHYISRLYERPDCSLIFTGFQVPGTAGRTLLDTGKFVHEDIEVRPRMRMEFLDFSAHTDHDHLVQFYKKVKPKKILLVHGEKTNEFAKELQKQGFDAHAPKNGETIEV
ncbi:MAG: MBL fold metallo-hydrolase [Candidatus Aenigmarchaeota archaeon]|nr:MBL fold metallo-hydrolase [Candidatus Aenigmarchaeota archaeon]